MFHQASLETIPVEILHEIIMHAEDDDLINTTNSAGILRVSKRLAANAIRTKITFTDLIDNPMPFAVPDTITNNPSTSASRFADTLEWHLNPGSISDVECVVCTNIKGVTKIARFTVSEHGFYYDFDRGCSLKWRDTWCDLYSWRTSDVPSDVSAVDMLTLYLGGVITIVRIILANGGVFKCRINRINRIKYPVEKVVKYMFPWTTEITTSIADEYAGLLDVLVDGPIGCSETLRSIING